MPADTAHRAADDEWFNTLYVTYASRVKALLSRLSHPNATHLDDLVQETFTSLYELRHCVDKAADPWPLLATIARRRHIDHIRRHARSATIATVDATSAIADSSEQRVIDQVAVTEALRSLPVPHRQALLLIHGQDLTYAEASAITGRAPKTLRNAASLGRAEFRQNFLRTTAGQAVILVRRSWRRARERCRTRPSPVAIEALRATIEATAAAVTVALASTAGGFPQLDEHVRGAALRAAVAGSHPKPDSTGGDTAAATTARTAPTTPGPGRRDSAPTPIVAVEISTQRPLHPPEAAQLELSVSATVALPGAPTIRKTTATTYPCGPPVTDYTTDTGGHARVHLSCNETETRPQRS